MVSSLECRRRPLPPRPNGLPVCLVSFPFLCQLFSSSFHTQKTSIQCRNAIDRRREGALSRAASVYESICVLDPFHTGASATADPQSKGVLSIWIIISRAAPTNNTTILGGLMLPVANETSCNGSQGTPFQHTHTHSKSAVHSKSGGSGRRRVVVAPQTC